MERQLDVHLELDPMKLLAELNPTRTVAELARREAEAQAAKIGGILRHPEPTQLSYKQGIKATTGRDVFLVATRWTVDV